MGLCGSESCGCAITSTPATTGEINGTFPSIAISGNGTPQTPWNLSLNEDWAAEVADAVNDYVLGEWQDDWTPTYGNLTLGNGTSQGWYCVVPGGVQWSARLTWGSTTSLAGALSIGMASCPAISGDPAVLALGFGSIWDASAGEFLCAFRGATSNLFGYTDTNNITATNPMTWTTGDILDSAGLYPLNPA